MPDSPAHFPPPPMAEPIRPRTLIGLRWVAVAGQMAAVVVALALGLRFDWAGVVVVIAAAAAFNFWLSLPGRGGPVRPAAQLGFDLVQLAALLALTGGLSNPFGLLVLAPVTIAATALGGRETAALGVATVAMITLAGWLARPLADADGTALVLPPLLMAGHWVALVIGVAFFALYAHRVSHELSATSAALAATQMALAREQKLQHLGGVVAAAAHEMGTPLATMKLVASELGDEIAEALPDRPDLADDITLLRDSVDRCRDILRSMGQAGKDDLILHRAPLLTLLEEAASPHEGRRETQIMASPRADGPEPFVLRDPAIMHGLRNLIQNAVDFARARVTVTACWGVDAITITIRDDGPGFPPALLARIGEPFLTTRGEDGRGHYEGMGLGVFIAKTLLERAGASLHFTNREPGAEVLIRWPRVALEQHQSSVIGENPTITG